MTNSLNLTESQKFALLCLADRGAHSGRGGLSAHTFRALERRGLCTMGAQHTWETDWRLTDTGRSFAKALEEGQRRGRAFRNAERA